MAVAPVPTFDIPSPSRPSVHLPVVRDGDEITLPRSRRRRSPVPRATLAADSPETLGNLRLTRAERAEMAIDLEHLDGVDFGPPADDRDCPPGPCGHVGCRYHLYIEVDGDRTTLMFPGRHIDEIPETCSLRAARAPLPRRGNSKNAGAPAMTCAEVGRFLNLTAETVRRELETALEKLRAARGLGAEPARDRRRK